MVVLVVAAVATTITMLASGLVSMPLLCLYVLLKRPYRSRFLAVAAVAALATLLLAAVLTATGLAGSHGSGGRPPLPPAAAGLR